MNLTDVYIQKELNPGSVPVVTREYQHSVMSLLEGARAGFDGLRGGYGTADHVDIMGNHHVCGSGREKEGGGRGGERRREEGGWRGGERVSRDTMSNHYVCGESGKGGASNTIT